MPRPLVLCLALAAAVALPSSRASAQTLLADAAFLAPQAAGLAGGTGELTVADVNEDDLPDVLVPGGGGGGVHVFVGQASGGLVQGQTADTPVLPDILCPGDLDHDGDLDLVVAAFALFSAPLGVVYGDGEGGFTNGGLLATAFGPATGLDLGDLDGDGALDIAFTMAWGTGHLGGLRTLLGDGTGGFGPEVFMPMPLLLESASALVISEQTGDEWPDVFVRTFTPSVVTPSVERLRLFAGTGGGHFAAPTAPLAEAGRVLVADLDADTREDVIQLGLSSVSVYYQQAPGVLEPPVTTDLGSPLLGAVTLGEIDGDSVPDMLVHIDAGLVQLMGTAADGFHAGTPTDISLKYKLEALAVLDVDRDGRADALYRRRSSNASNAPTLLELARGDGAGGFLAAPTQPAPAQALKGLASGDFDGDGLIDLASDANGPEGLAVFRGGGAAGLLPAVVVPDVPLGLVADLDEDGRSDLVTQVISNDFVEVRLETGGLSFGPPTSWPVGSNARPGGVADLDADGHLDVVASSDDFSLPAFRVLLGDGAGNLGAPILSDSTGLALPVAFADVNLDGFLDVASCGSTEIFAFLGDGAGQLVLGPVKNIAGAGNLVRIETGDVDGDGDADLAAVSLAQYSAKLAMVPIVAGAFGSATTLTVPFFGVNGFTLRDMDGDADLDAVGAGGSSGFVTILRGDGAGGFPQAERYNVLGTASNAVVLDIDGDGRPDVAALDDGTGAELALLRASPTPWANLGHALAGGGQAPVLQGTGTLLPHSVGALDLHGLPASTATSVFFGLEAAYAPFHGGTLVPAGLMRLVVPTSPDGDVHLGWSDFPALPASLVFYVQAWTADASAPSGLSASNAVSATVP